ncbi:MAG: ABC-type transport auxiliary lipoprotein family protein [Hyphomonadaceae bacterium]|nr:ABC-type transport auxiliary lipoprotein family protein [Hyphomonadaceae bacterium]
MRSIAVLAVVASSLLGGCISLLPDPPPPAAIYSLRAGEVARQAAPAKDVVIGVSEPVAPRSAAGADIVWRTGPQIAFMERAAWDGAAPDLLQDMLIDTIERRGGARAVVRMGAGVRSDVSVQWDVLAFEVVEGEGPLEASIALSVRLVDMRTRAITRVERFSARAPISQRSGRAAAAALERAAGDAMVKIADWAIANAEPPQPSAASTSR